MRRSRYNGISLSMWSSCTFEVLAVCCWITNCCPCNESMPRASHWEYLVSLLEVQEEDWLGLGT